MKLDLLSGEEFEKFEAARKEQEARAAERTKAFEAAVRSALAQVGYKLNKLVIREFTPSIGGGYVMLKGDAGYFADVEKRVLKAGKGSDDEQTIVAEVVQNDKIRLHPPMGDLHAIRREEAPGIFTTMFVEWQKACSGEGNG